MNILHWACLIFLCTVIASPALAWMTAWWVPVCTVLLAFLVMVFLGAVNS